MGKSECEQGKMNLLLFFVNVTNSGYLPSADSAFGISSQQHLSINVDDFDMIIHSIVQNRGPISDGSSILLKGTDCVDSPNLNCKISTKRVPP